jgi:ethanolamine ammonia-lyase large subunit
MGIPGSDDIMLNYQTTSFHDALYARRVLDLRPAPEFEAWLDNNAIMAADGHFTPAAIPPKRFSRALSLLDRQ